MFLPGKKKDRFSVLPEHAPGQKKTAQPTGRAAFPGNPFPMPVNL
jgi:hypothetical protein